MRLERDRKTIPARELVRAVPNHSIAWVRAQLSEPVGDASRTARPPRGPARRPTRSPRSAGLLTSGGWCVVTAVTISAMNGVVSSGELPTELATGCDVARGPPSTPSKAPLLTCVRPPRAEPKSPRARAHHELHREEPSSAGASARSRPNDEARARRRREPKLTGLDQPPDSSRSSAPSARAECSPATRRS